MDAKRKILLILTALPLMVTGCSEKVDVVADVVADVVIAEASSGVSSMKMIFVDGVYYSENDDLKLVTLNFKEYPQPHSSGIDVNLSMMIYCPTKCYSPSTYGPQEVILDSNVLKAYYSYHFYRSAFNEGESIRYRFQSSVINGESVMNNLYVARNSGQLSLSGSMVGTANVKGVEHFTVISFPSHLPLGKVSSKDKMKFLASGMSKASSIIEKEFDIKDN